MTQHSGLIEELLHNLPDTPGVYLMRDDEDNIIYVGKAVSLRNRVRQYFHSPQEHPKVQAMVEKVHRFEVIMTDTEMEALTLESSLIQNYSPKYNIKLKDDKHFPFVRIDVRQPFPRIEIVRRVKDDGAKYFGPFLAANDIRGALDAVKKIFPVRSCKQELGPQGAKTRKRPCLMYDLGQCLAPCQGTVGTEEYRDLIRQVELFLTGKQEQVVDILREQMMEAAEKMQFERAGYLRDRLQIIDRILQRQRAILTNVADRDVLAVYERDGVGVWQLFLVRGGHIVGREHLMLNSGAEQEEQMLEQMLLHFYENATALPGEILIPTKLYNHEQVEQWLCSRRGAKVRLIVPRRGEKKQLIELAQKNAREAWERSTQQAQIKQRRVDSALEGLRTALELDKVPRRIEGFDISNIQGTDSVASMVVFIDGAPARKEYRRFKIKTVEGPNDYASMSEVITRRFTRGLREEQEGSTASGFGQMPDAVLIDGGKGQLGVALEAIDSLGIKGRFPMFGLAERFEEVYVEGRSDPIFIARGSDTLHLLQSIRDEAHRFALTFHRSLRGKHGLQSLLEEIEGIGKARRQALFAAYRSLDQIRAASAEELAKVEGMNKTAARAVYDFFHEAGQGGGQTV